jgi:hypothetical protein
LGYSDQEVEEFKRLGIIKAALKAN